MVHRGQQSVRNSRSVQYTEARNMWEIQGPYSAPRAETCEKFKVRTVHRGKKRVRNSRSVQYTNARNMWKIQDPYITPRPALKF
jgi:hypothetical protein